MYVSGIYFIMNKLDGKVYVGSAQDIKKRIVRHRSQLNHQTHPNQHLQLAWNKYGEENFTFDILELVDIPDLIKIENQYLKIAERLPDRYYNIAYDATSPMRGRKISTETKLKLSAVWKGRKHTEEAKRKMRLAVKVKMLDEQKLKMSLARIGKSIHSKEYIEELRVKNKGLNNPALNKTIYTFRHKVTGESYTGIQYEFYTKYNLDKRGVNALVKDKLSSYKKWEVI
jgi:group I intron endonuclease